MKSFKLLLASLALVCGQASAAPVTFTDTVTYTPPVRLSANNVVEWVYFNILDHGYNPLTDTITSYTATFNLFDDQDNASERARIGQFGSGDAIFTDLSGTETILSSTFGELVVDAYGQTVFSIATLPTQWFIILPIAWGDFYIGGATLTVNAERVPEPGSMLLIGAALTAAAFAGRRRKQ